MVAADTLLSSIEKMLSLHGFRYTLRQAVEKDLFGSVKEVVLIHASTTDENTILTIRLFKNGVNRVRISFRNVNDKLRNKIENLENKGFNIYDDENEVSVIGMFRNNELLSILPEIMRIVV